MLTKPLLKKVIRIALGVLSLILGIIGGFLPVVQGWIFILLGLYLLSYDIPWVRRHLDRLRKRFPRHAARLRKNESRMILRWRMTKRFFRRKSLEPTPVKGVQGVSGIKNEAPK